MTNDDVDTIDELFAKASGGTWEAEQVGELCDGWGLVSDAGPREFTEARWGTGGHCIVVHGCIGQPESELIATLRNAWPAIRDALRERNALKAELEAVAERQPNNT